MQQAAPTTTDSQTGTHFPGMSPLFLDGVLEFNQLKWGMKPLHLRLAEDGSALPAVDAVYYLDRRGRVCKPGTSTYLPVAFYPTPTQSRARLDRQWIATGSLLAADMSRRGVVGSLALPPEIVDVRPWQRVGFHVDVRYTFYADLPYDDRILDNAVRRQITKAAKAGFRCERVASMSDVVHCVADTQHRQGFSYGMSNEDLTLIQMLAGADHVRAYVCYAPDGAPVSARVALHQPGSRAIDWLAGTTSEYLNSGATQLLLRSMLDDLYASGAIAIDFEGANLRSVASAKAQWGATLVPFYVVSTPHLKAVARHARDYIRFRQSSPGIRAQHEKRSSGQ